MVSCLSLMLNSHILAGKQDGCSRTICGLAIASEHVVPAMFVETSDVPTCLECRRRNVAAKEAGGLPIRSTDPKSLVVDLVDRLNANDARGVAQCLAGPLASDFAPAKLARLHSIFPNWRATVDEIVADGQTVVLRYDVTCVDAFGLLQSQEPDIGRKQTVILRLSSKGVTGIDAIVDDFDVWQIATQPSQSGRKPVCCDPPDRHECTT
jgi:hypothetical protein